MSHTTVLRLAVPTAALALLAGRALVTSGAPAQGPTTTRTRVLPSDSAAVAATVARFHGALASGDSTAALALLAPDATVLESGGLETRDEYRRHHLPDDIDFARAVPSVRQPVRVRVIADAAWAITTSVTEGEYRGRAVNSAGAELVVLRRTADGWRIAAIHWSSRARRR